MSPRGSCVRGLAPKVLLSRGAGIQYVIGGEPLKGLVGPWTLPCMVLFCDTMTTGPEQWSQDRDRNLQNGEPK
jgi:hypothetical protein